MDIHYFLVTVLSNCTVIPTALLSLAPMRHQLRHSPGSVLLRIGLVSAVLIAAGSYIQCCFELTPNAVMMPMLTILFFMYHLELKVHISKSAAIFVYVCAVMSVFANTANGIDALINPEASAIVLTDENAVLQSGISALGAVLLFWPMWKYGSYLADNFDIANIWYITVLFSAVVLCVNASMVPRKYETLYTNNVFRIYWSLQIMFLIFALLIAVIFYQIVNSLLKAAKNEARSHILEMQEDSYIKQQRYIEETARARHDFKQIVRTLNAMAADNDLEGIKYYLGKYAESVPENDVRHYCDNSAVNALLNHYAQSAVRNNISTNWEIDLPGSVNIDDLDLCITVGNILDNAITACCQVSDENRYIKLTVKLLDGLNLCIIAVNSFNGKVRKKDDRYLSTNRKGSGIGLSSVTSVAEQNGGTAHFYHEGNEFFSEVMIKAAKAEKKA